MFKYFIALILVFPSLGLAQSEVYSRVVQKHIKKVQDRWTVESLYLRSKSSGRKRNWSPWKAPMLEMLVDFNFGPGQLYKTGASDKDTEALNLGTQLQFHYGAVGIGLEKFQTKISEKNVFVKRDDITLIYRLFGPSTQSTYLTLLAGYQGGEHSDYGEVHHQYYGLLTNIYFFRHMGFEGLYKIRNEIQTASHRLGGENYHWGIFWEFSILRIYFNFSQDYYKGKNLSTDQELNQHISSSVFGARLAF